MEHGLDRPKEEPNGTWRSRRVGGLFHTGGLRGECSPKVWAPKTQARKAIYTFLLPYTWQFGACGKQGRKNPEEPWGRREGLEFPCWLYWPFWSNILTIHVFLIIPPSDAPLNILFLGGIILIYDRLVALQSQYTSGGSIYDRVFYEFCTGI